MGEDLYCLSKAWRVVAILLILFCLGMIFLFSGQDGPSSDSLSTQVTVVITRLATGETPDVHSSAFARAHRIVRKIAHATEYGMLAASCALLTHTFPLATRRRFLFAGVACLPTAALDEYLQTFHPGRNGSPVDVCIDMLGACAALLLVFLLTRLLRKRRQKCVKHGESGDYSLS